MNDAMSVPTGCATAGRLSPSELAAMDLQMVGDPSLALSPKWALRPDAASLE
jgi:hypothetical protein